MNEPSDKRGIIVGLFILTGIAILIAGILIIGNLHETFRQKITVFVIFEDVNGLKVGNNVFFSGMKIGTVNDLEFYAKSEVKVIFNIEKKVQPYIRKDAKVKISTDGFIGNKILIIYGGTQMAGEVQEDDTLGAEKFFSSEEMINTLQDNNNNLKSITGDFKIISNKLANGEGTIGKLLKDSSVYMNINAATASLREASAKAQQLISSLSTFSSGLNKKGTLANQLVTDTIVFNSIKSSVLKLRSIADAATVFVNTLKEAGNNPKSPVGVLMHDEQAGASLKTTISNLESSSKKLDKDLEALQHSFLLKNYFKKESKKDGK